MNQSVLFDTFNAKYLSYKEIAETFIFNHQFEELIKNNNSLLMGPRGSGKTTMLKMLTPLGLHHWTGKKAGSVRSKIPFTAIYIPTDIQWKRQIEQLASDLSAFPKYADVVSRALVTANILLAVTSTFRSLIELHSEQSDILNNEANISRELVKVWKIEHAASPTFMALETALMDRVTNIKNHIRKTIYTAKDESDVEYPGFFFDDYMDLVRISCKTFENEFSSINHPLKGVTRWALCFDELEIAPRWLQIELLNHLRGRDQNILFKLTTSPIVSTYDETNKAYSKIEAQEDNDFKVIRIWLHNQIERQNWIKFSERLIEEKLHRKFAKGTSANALFGRSNLERAVIQELNLSERKIAKASGKTYGPGTPFWVLFKELAASNPSFKKFLVSKKIDPNSPVPKDDSQKDSIYRKIKQLAAYRYILLKDENQKRSRKIIPLFFGVPYIYEISDGNPRQLIGMLDELLSNAATDESGDIKPLSINLQSRIISNISHRFLEQVDSHPEANKIIGKKHMHLGEIIRIIGQFFHKEMITDDFKMDPRNTFRIDENINQKFVDLVQLALHLGIIIYVNPKEAISQKGLLDKEFRLNYLLSPYFKILAREYDSPVRLSQMFKNDSQSEQQKIIFS
jgi:hypothetical protein